MATESEAVNYHKRIAMGEKLDGTSLRAAGKAPAAPKQAPKAPPARRSAGRGR